MMKKFCFVFFFLSAFVAFGQVTKNPSIKRKSAEGVFVTQVELTEDFTIISMYFEGKSPEEQIREELLQNPRKRQELQNLDPETRKMYLWKWENDIKSGRIGETISIQSSSVLRTRNGNFKFIKATGIPVSPKKMVAAASRTYSFKVYYERLTPGIEIFDFFEGTNQERSTVHYWNFYGVEVDNPANNPKEELPKEKNEPILPVLLTLTGKIFDAETKQPIAAKIVCIKKDVRFDSIQISRAGTYEFAVSPDSYSYEVSATRYETKLENLDFSLLSRSKRFNQDIFLTPLPPPIKKDTLVALPKKDTLAKAPVKVDKNTFRLDKVYFELGKANLLPESYEQLDGLVAMMKDKSSIKIRVEGHTDNLGDSKLNKKLSMERAFRVREYLINRGINGNRISLVGYGDTRPVYPSDTEENRKRNRRVEFVILEE